MSGRVTLEDLKKITPNKKGKPRSSSLKRYIPNLAELSSNYRNPDIVNHSLTTSPDIVNHSLTTSPDIVNHSLTTSKGKKRVFKRSYKGKSIEQINGKMYHILQFLYHLHLKTNPLNELVVASKELVEVLGSSEGAIRIFLKRLQEASFLKVKKSLPGRNSSRSIELSSSVYEHFSQKTTPISLTTSPPNSSSSSNITTTTTSEVESDPTMIFPDQYPSLSKHGISSVEVKNGISKQECFLDSKVLLNTLKALDLFFEEKELRNDPVLKRYKPQALFVMTLKQGPKHPKEFEGRVLELKKKEKQKEKDLELKIKLKERERIKRIEEERKEEERKNSLLKWESLNERERKLYLNLAEKECINNNPNIEKIFLQPVINERALEIFTMNL